MYDATTELAENTREQVSPWGDGVSVALWQSTTMLRLRVFRAIRITPTLIQNAVGARSRARASIQLYTPGGTHASA